LGLLVAIVANSGASSIGSASGGIVAVMGQTLSEASAGGSAKPPLSG
jgi:hypothetical protein